MSVRNREALSLAPAIQAAGLEALRTLQYPGEICLIGEEYFPPYERPPLSKDILLKP